MEESRRSLAKIAKTAKKNSEIRNSGFQSPGFFLGDLGGLGERHFRSSLLYQPRAK
jgi:hypothetical protein